MEPANSTTDVTISDRTLQSSGQIAKIISDEITFYFQAVSSIGLVIVISTLGVTTNILNIIIYWKHKFKETVNITFLSLSMWDLNICLLSFITSLCFIFEDEFSLQYVDLASVQYVYIAYTRGYMYVLSTLATVYLSIERSMSIVFPLQVKYIFTTLRVVLINVIIVIFGFACFSPAWATQGLHWEFNPEINTSRLVLFVSLNRRYVDLFVDSFAGIVIPVLAQMIITAGAAFMIRGINKSTKFRNQISVSEKRKQTVFNVASVSTTTPSDIPGKNKLMASKDVKLTKVIIMLAAIFFACNLPVFLVALLRALLPELDVGAEQYNLYTVLYGLVYHCGLINSSVNFIVYYHVSARYKRDLRLLFILSTSTVNSH